MATKTALDAYKEGPESVKNKAANDITKDLESYADSVGEKLKNKFNFGGILDKLNSFGENLPFGDRLNALANEFLSAQIDKFKQALSESAEASFKALTHLATGAIKKLIDAAITHISYNDVMYVAAITPLYQSGANLSYMNDYARSTAIKYDFPISLEWIDSVLGIRYGIIDSKQRSKLMMLSSTASTYSCPDVFLYAWKQAKVEYDKSILPQIKSYESRINDQEQAIKIYEKTIADLQIEYNKDVTTEIRKEEIDNLIGLEKQKINTANETIKTLQNEKKKWDELEHNYFDNLAKYFKKLLLGSVGNLTHTKVYEITTTLGVKPAWFGDYDPDFNSRYTLTLGDVNTLAPFYNDSGFIKTTQNYLGDTRLVQTSKIPKTIVLKNIFLKYIYITLNNTNIYGIDNQLSSEVLYERLQYQTMDFLTETLDEAAGMLVQDGFGKMAMDALLAIERAIYDYTKFIEPSMVLPRNRKYVLLPSYFQTLPAPLIPYEESPSIPGQKYEGILLAEGKLSTRDFKQMISYYLKYMVPEQRYTLLRDLFIALRTLYNSHQSEEYTYAFYEFFLTKYWSKDMLDNEFNADEYFKNIEDLVLFNNYYILMRALYYKEYISISGLNDENREAVKIELDKVFIDSYTKLKELSLEYEFSTKTLEQITSDLIFIYTIMGEYAVMNVKFTETIMTFLRKHYTNDAYKPTFYIEKYIDSLSLEEKKSKLKAIYKELDEKTRTDPIFKQLTVMYKKIMVTVLPAYETIIRIEENNKNDIDLNDPTIKEEIETELKYNSLFKEWVKDFDNKLWKEESQSIETDLDNTEFKYDDYFEYTVFIGKK